MKARLSNHSQLSALRRRLRQQAAGAKPLASPKKKTVTSHSDSHPRRHETGPLSATDRALFRQAMRTVQPLQTQARYTPPPSVLIPSSEQIKQRRERAESHHHDYLNTQLSDDYDAWVPNEPIDEYLNPICGTDVLRNLKRGQWPIEASIDLHGATLERARERLQSFLQYCLAEQYRCIRIVHGKGYGSANQEPILLYQIRRWLTQLSSVLAFCHCPPKEGGQGAVKVLLRKKRL